MFLLMGYWWVYFRFIILLRAGSHTDLLSWLFGWCYRDMYQTMQYGTCTKINADKAWKNKSAYQALFAEGTSLTTLIKLPNCRRYMYLFHWS